MAEVLIALGSNVGDRLGFLQAAVAELAGFVCLKAASHVYSTDPMYVTDQPDFMNAAVLADTTRSPRNLLCVLKSIEASIGRNITPRNGPREIDLDLVAYGCLIYRYREAGVMKLEVPHPRTAERRFVLQPLADVAPNFVLPGIGSVASLLAQTQSQRESVKRIEDAFLPI